MHKRLRQSILFSVLSFSFIIILPASSIAEKNPHNTLQQQCLAAMEKATCFMVDSISTRGGYVWHYLPDISRRWGEMEAYETMIWVQHPGTASMGHLFLDAYHATGNELYYEAAEKAARAIIWGQLDCGGWNYMIDFAGESSLKKWYATIGKNGWRLEEFMYYYGNATFDDDVSIVAARFLLRMYLEDMDPLYKYPLDKAINFILKSQYPIGGWPQRFPLRYDFTFKGFPDYSSFYTFNDDVVWENVNFLIQCYQTLGDNRLLDPILRGMNFYIITQQGEPQAGWAQQYDINLKPASARTYEPRAFAPRITRKNIQYLIQFYQLTGETKFLSGIPLALEWLENCRLSKSMNDNGKYSHPVFVEIGTNKPIFVHKKGTNVVNGYYYTDYKEGNPVGHYAQKCFIDVDQLRKQYKETKKLSSEEVTQNSPIIKKAGRISNIYYPQEYYFLKDTESPDETEITRIINALDDKGRWLVRHKKTSDSYIDEHTNTSPYKDTSDQDYIATSEYIRNMTVLIHYIK
jgi:hypothetical protein